MPIRIACTPPRTEHVPYFLLDTVRKGSQRADEHKIRINGASCKTLESKGKWSFRASEARPGIQDFQAILDSGACPGPDPGFAGMTD